MEANSEKPKAEEETEAEKPSELDTLKKDLEAREKEVVDLKVCRNIELICRLHAIDRS